MHYTRDLCVIGKCYKYTIIYNDTLINLISHTFFKTKLNHYETVTLFITSDSKRSPFTYGNVMFLCK